MGSYSSTISQLESLKDLPIMKIQLLLVGVLCWIASANPSKCKPRPFGCYAYEWEKDVGNKDKDIKHAFLTDEWYNSNCKSEPACDDDCPSDFAFTVDNIEEKGLSVNCKISLHFCDNVQAKKDRCIETRIVKVRVDPAPTPASKPIATTKAARRHREEEIRGFEDLFNIRARRNEMPQQLTPAAAKAPVTVDVKAIVLPVCLLGEPLDACKKRSGKNGEICKENQLKDGTPIKGNLCTALESAFGGEYPASVINDTVHYAKVSNIWKSTGLPYAAVTSYKADFLPGGSKDGKTKPLCEGDGQKVMWKGNKYTLQKFGPTECVAACTDANQDLWLKATGEETSLECLVLDIEGFPLHRRGRMPLAKFMDAKDNLNKTKLLQKADASSRKKDGNITASYPLPIDYSSIKDETMRKQVEASLWLNNKTNPFAKKYGSHIKTLDVTDCGENDPDTKICNKKGGGKGDKKSAVIALVTILLLIICYCLLVSSSVGVGIAVYCIIKKKKAKKAAAAGTDEGEAAASEAEGGEEIKSTATQTGQNDLNKSLLIVDPV